MHRLKQGLGYIATPYTLHPEGTDYAYRVSCGLIAHLTGKGLNVYSPIAHWHTATILDPQKRLERLSSDEWFKLNTPMMELSAWMLVPYDRDDNWKHSQGIHKERLYFHQSGKPVYFYQSHRERIDLLSDVLRAA